MLRCVTVYRVRRGRKPRHDRERRRTGHLPEGLLGNERARIIERLLAIDLAGSILDETQIL